MLAEAELFVMTEVMLVEVLGRIRESDREIVLPVIYGIPGSDGAAPLRAVVARYVRDEAGVPAILGETPSDEGRLDELEFVPTETAQAAVVQVSEAATRAASRVVDGGRVARSPLGALAVADYLLALTVSRSLLAHYVAAYLGSTACPLPEELARPLWEATRADVRTWRDRGAFRDPLPIPELASWRDTFLRTAGHEPHPLGH